jgi:hypothetical protein
LNVRSREEACPIILSLRELDVLTVMIRRARFEVVPHGRHPRTGHRCSGHVSLVMPLTANDSFHLGGSINRWGSAPRYLSWIFDILDILVS